MGEQVQTPRRGAEGSAPGFWAAHHQGELTVFVVCLALVLVTAVVGGFRDATPPVVERTPGQVVDLDPLRVVVTGAAFTGSADADVALRVTNLSSAPRPVAGLRNVWIADGAAPLEARAVDPTIADLNPGMPVDLVVRAPVGGWVGTPSLTVLLRDDPPDADPLTGQRGDEPGVPVARVTVPVGPAG